MNQHSLHDALRDAADGIEPSQVDEHDLVRRGRRSVRRRTAATAVGAAACLTVAAGTAYGLWPQHETTSRQLQPAGPNETPTAGHRSSAPSDGPSQPGAFDPATVDFGEATRRCDVASRRLGEAPLDGRQIRWTVAGGGTPAHVTEGSLLVGHVKPPEGNQPYVAISPRCWVPQHPSTVGDVDGSELTPDMTEGEIARACGDYRGFDVTGWSTRLTSATDGSAAGAFASSDGYHLLCTLSVMPNGTWGYVDLMHDVDLTETADSAAPLEIWPDYTSTDGGDGVAVSYAGPITEGADVARVRLSYDGGSQTFPVHDGLVAFVATLPITRQRDTPLPLRFTMLDADGDVLHAYDHADLPRKAWED